MFKKLMAVIVMLGSILSVGVLPVKALTPPIVFSGYVAPNLKDAGAQKSGFEVKVLETQMSAVTDEEGFFEILGGMRSFSVSISKPGYVTRQVDNIEIEGSGTSVWELSSPITLLPGDMPQGGSQDGAVTIGDIMYIAFRFGATAAHERYDKIADLNCDLAINMGDIMTVAENIGKTAVDYGSIVVATPNPLPTPLPKAKFRIGQNEVLAKETTAALVFEVFVEEPGTNPNDIYVSYWQKDKEVITTVKPSSTVLQDRVTMACDMDGLSKDTTYFYKFSFDDINIYSFHTAPADTVPTNTPFQWASLYFITEDAKEITSESATISGRTRLEGNLMYSPDYGARLVYWEEGQESNKIVVAHSTLVYYPVNLSSTLYNLKPDTLYYYKLDDFGTRGDVKSFRTLPE